MNKFLDFVKEKVRYVFGLFAKYLHRVTGGVLTPNNITIAGLLAHLPIAYFIAQQKNIIAALMLVFFGLFDTLDGALARVQKKSGSGGMLLDASTDRMKEIMLYTGVAWALIGSDHPHRAIVAVIACGSSMLVSYVKAKGETAVKDSNLSPNEVNKLFADGIMRFEVRMFFLVVGLLTNQLYFAIIGIAEGSTMTAIARLVRISRKLK